MQSVFVKSKNVLIFNSDFFSIPVIEPNEKLLCLLEKNAQEILKKLNDCNFLKIETIAKKLLLSVRSLQLYLRKEDTSYNKLVKEIRKSTAGKYLNDINISIDEIAYILGFSENSAFYRAFQSWTGILMQFRKSLLNYWNYKSKFCLDYFYNLF